MEARAKKMMKQKQLFTHHIENLWDVAESSAARKLVLQQSANNLIYADACHFLMKLMCDFALASEEIHKDHLTDWWNLLRNDGLMKVAEERLNKLDW